MGLMLELLNARGEVAVVGRRGSSASGTSPSAGTRRPRRVSLAGGERHVRRSSGSARWASGSSAGRLLAHPDAVEDGSVPDASTFLSPFDRLVHDRDRAEALWGFRYRLEMYVPAAKREYGYYVLPILRGDRIVGRIEPVHDRKTGVLHVRGVWWEDGVRPAPLDQPLRRLARWLGATIA